MRLPKSIKIYGDINFRDKYCRSENAEQKEFFGLLKEHRPHYFEVAIHPKNEGIRSYKQAASEAVLGALNTGASDIIIPAQIAFVCEMKRTDHTLSTISKPQIKYLEAAQLLGAFSCIALGSCAAWEALLDWEKQINKINAK